jgi:hypothetical protein
LEYLGHIVTSEGVATDPVKIWAVKEWPVPKNVKALRGFLGLAGYYSRFIKHFGVISRPLTRLLKKGVQFVCTVEVQQAFELVQQALITAPVLALPDFAKQFIIEIDACNMGIGVVLMQEGHPIAYLSQGLNCLNQGCPTYEKECLAILLAVDKWRSYLQHREFVIRTDQRSLAQLGEQRLTTGIQHKAFVKLLGLQYKIQYKKGATNSAADALSHREPQEACAISTCTPSWVEKVILGYHDNEDFNSVYKLHGLPDAIVTNRDKIFTSPLWKELFRLSDTQLLMSSSYHPKTDGQTECLNQCLETLLHCAVHSSPAKWYFWLPLVEYWYNTSFQSAIGLTLFEVLYGHSPKHFGISDLNTCSVPDLEEWLSDRQTFIKLIQAQLTRAQQRMKCQADKHRSEREFQVGDLVYLEVQPYVQVSLAPRSCQKLAFRFFGLYKILQRIGKVAYKLDLPDHAKIHNVVHVSQLKKHIPSSMVISSDINVINAIDSSVPVACLVQQLIKKARATALRMLVRWRGLPSSLATWEEYETLKMAHPSTSACGRVYLKCEVM